MSVEVNESTDSFSAYVARLKPIINYGPEDFDISPNNVANAIAMLQRFVPAQTLRIVILRHSETTFGFVVKLGDEYHVSAPFTGKKSAKYAACALYKRLASRTTAGIAPVFSAQPTGAKEPTVKYTSHAGLVQKWNDIPAPTTDVRRVREFLRTIGKDVHFVRVTFDSSDIVSVFRPFITCCSGVPMSLTDDLVIGTLWWSSANAADKKSYELFIKPPVNANALRQVFAALLLVRKPEDALDLAVSEWNKSEADLLQFAKNIFAANALNALSDNMARFAAVSTVVYDKTKVFATEADARNALMHALNGNTVRSDVHSMMTMMTDSDDELDMMLKDEEVPNCEFYYNVGSDQCHGKAILCHMDSSSHMSHFIHAMANPMDLDHTVGNLQYTLSFRHKVVSKSVSHVDENNVKKLILLVMRKYFVSTMPYYEAELEKTVLAAPEFVYDYSAVPEGNKFSHYSEFVADNALPVPEFRSIADNGIVNIYGSDDAVLNVPDGTRILQCCGFLWYQGQTPETQKAYDDQHPMLVRTSIHAQLEGKLHRSMAASAKHVKLNTAVKKHKSDRAVRVRSKEEVAKMLAALSHRNAVLQNKVKSAQQVLSKRDKPVHKKQHEKGNHKHPKEGKAHKKKEENHKKPKEPSQRPVEKALVKVGVKASQMKPRSPAYQASNILSNMKYSSNASKPVYKTAAVMKAPGVTSIRGSEYNHFRKAVLADDMTNPTLVKSAILNMLFPDADMNEVPPVRYASDDGGIPTATAAIKRLINVSIPSTTDGTLLSRPDSFFVFRRDPYASTMWYEPNVTKLVSMYRCQFVREVINNGNPVPQIGLNNSVDIMGGEYVRPLYMTPADGNSLKHNGDVWYPLEGEDGGYYFHLTAGSQVYVSFTNNSGATLVVGAALIFDSAGTPYELTQFSGSIANGSILNTALTTNVSGYHCIKVYSSFGPMSNNNFTMGINIINGTYLASDGQGLAVVSQRPVAGITERAADILGIRTIGVSGMVSNFTNLFSVQGNMTGMIIPGDRSWCELLDTKDPSKMLVASQTMVIGQETEDNGMRAWIPPNGPDDFNFNTTMSYRNATFMGARGRLYDNSECIVFYYTNNNNASMTVQITDGRRLEFQTMSQWYETRDSEFTVNEWEEATDLVRAVPCVTSNPAHVYAIFKSILKGVRTHAATVGAWVGKLAGMLDDAT